MLTPSDTTRVVNKHFRLESSLKLTEDGWPESDGVQAMTDSQTKQLKWQQRQRNACYNNLTN